MKMSDLNAAERAYIDGMHDMLVRVLEILRREQSPVFDFEEDEFPVPSDAQLQEFGGVDGWKRHLRYLQSYAVGRARLPVACLTGDVFPTRYCADGEPRAPGEDTEKLAAIHERDEIQRTLGGASEATLARLNPAAHPSPNPETGEM